MLRLKPVYKKLDFQISRYVSLAGRDLAENEWNQQEDLLFMRPNLAFEDMGDPQPVDDDEFDSMTRTAIQRKVDRAMEMAYEPNGKTDKKSLFQAIRDKRDKMSKEHKKDARLEQFKKKRLLQSNIVRDLEDEIDQRPIESEKRPNIAGVYDPMQEERERTNEKTFDRTVLTKKEKKVVNKRINRLKQLQRIDDFTEIKQFGKLMGKIGGVEQDEKPKISKSDKMHLWKKLIKIYYK